MKYVKFAVIVAVLFFLGYLLGPTLNPMLVKENDPKSVLESEVKYRGAYYRINLAKIRDGDLPEVIKVNENVTLKTENDEEVVVREGSELRLLNRDQNVLLVETLDRKAEGAINPKITDLYEYLAEAIYIREAGGSPLPTRPSQPRIAEVPSSPGTTESPAEVPAPTAPKVPVVPVEMPKVKDPEPPKMAEKEPEPAKVAPTSDEIVEIMKESIASGVLNEFKSADVTGWKASEPEMIDGKDYHIGLAAYNAVTIFGKKEVIAKALITDDRKVERWVYANTGMEVQ